jgi:hypothetical protein
MRINPLLSLFLVLLLIFTGCDKTKNNPVPNYPFDIAIDINLPSYNSLTGVGGWAYVAGGSKGIIVYRRSLDEFVAFDRHSPADVNGICAQPLYPDSSNFLQLNDDCNNAKFSLYDGSPIAGSDYGLRLYQTVYNGTSQLRIYN